MAVGQAGLQLVHALAEGHTRTGILGYAMVFFAVWWAWMNFTWFASAYDTDDVPYRIVTLIQIAGVLVLAAGVPRAFADNDWTVVVIGYVVMRVALTAQWLRAAASSRGRRSGRRPCGTRPASPLPGRLAGAAGPARRGTRPWLFLVAGAGRTAAFR